MIILSDGHQLRGGVSPKTQAVIFLASSAGDFVTWTSILDSSLLGKCEIGNGCIASGLKTKI